VHSLTRKLFWLAFWVIGFAVSMSGLLLYFKYQSVFTGLQRDRVLMVATEIDSIAEKNLSLGQDFWELATLQDVIERRRQADKMFTGIDVAGKDRPSGSRCSPATRS
jgi:transposase